MTLTQQRAAVTLRETAEQHCPKCRRTTLSCRGCPVLAEMKRLEVVVYPQRRRPRR